MTAPTGRRRGRPASPITKKEAEGNKGKRPLPQPLVVQFMDKDTEIPTPPPLGEDGLKMWEQIWRAGRLWLSPEADFFVVKQACEFFQEVELLKRQRALGEFPRWTTLPSGHTQAHAGVTMINETTKLMNQALSLLAFNPTDRAKLEIQLQEKKQTGLQKVMEDAQKAKQDRMDAYKAEKARKAEKATESLTEANEGEGAK